MVIFAFIYYIIMRITLCFIIFINLCISLFGQVHFTRLNNEDGLSHSEVKAILQDSYGYMWIGTRNKLNRYDGCEFKVLDCYDPVANRRNNNIAALCEDANRLLWIARTTEFLSMIRLWKLLRIWNVG